MRTFTILLSLFTLFLLPACANTQSATNGSASAPGSVSSLNQSDQWVIRLATDFSVIQSNLEEMITHPGVSDRTKVALKLLEQSLRQDVMRVVVAARTGDRDTVHRYLPSIARRVQKQILVLTISEDVTRQWAAARTKAHETITRIARLTPDTWQTVVAQLQSDGDRIQRA